MQQLIFHAMGCHMLAALDSEAQAARDGLANVPGWFADWEQRLSRFRHDSELSQLNRVAGMPVEVSGVLWGVVQAALEAAQHSDGLVTPTMLRELERAGYDRSFDILRSDGGPAEPGPSRCGNNVSPAVDWSTIICDAATRTIRIPPTARLDLGGVAKGWAADEAARRLSPYGPALIDAGGDIAVSGRLADGQRWPIGIADPADPDAQIDLLLLDAGGVATSGRDYRRWRHDGVWQHHILDPRTGRPAETDVLSATVVAQSARAAEIAAKTVLILGSCDGLAWLEARPAVAGLLVLDNGRVLRSTRLKHYVWR